MLNQIDLAQLEVAPTMHWSESFAAWLHEHDRRPNTITAYLQDLRHFGKFFEHENGEAFMPGLLNATDVKKYFARQDADKAVAVRSRNRRLASLNVLVEWAVAIGQLEYDPTVCIKRQPVESSPRDRTRDEISGMQSAVDDGSYLRCASDGHVWLGWRDRAIWELFKSAGLRIHEIAGLDVSDLDFESNTINIMGKGGKKVVSPATVDLMNEMRTWLNRRAVDASALITDKNGKRIKTGQIRRRIQMIGGAAGVGDIKPHELRHTFAYMLSDALMAQGLPMLTAMNGVRKQLRHADMKTTAIYFGVRESQIRAAMEVM